MVFSDLWFFLTIENVPKKVLLDISKLICSETDQGLHDQKTYHMSRNGQGVVSKILPHGGKLLCIETPNGMCQKTTTSCGINLLDVSKVKLYFKAVICLLVSFLDWRVSRAYQDEQQKDSRRKRKTKQERGTLIHVSKNRPLHYII